MIHFFSTSTREIHRSSCGQISWHFCTILLAFAFLPRPSTADRVTLDDGRVLDGTIALLPGISVDPQSTEDAGSTVVMCDNGLTRTFISKKRVVGATDEDSGQSINSSIDSIHNELGVLSDLLADSLPFLPSDVKLNK